ncbi:MAG: alpha-amylase [Cytophagales bacterium]|nr:alpha-amylase [Cytophagales bacterium]
MNSKPFSIEDIDLNPKPDKRYWKNCHREWREEFTYFLLVDRFHDDHKRNPIENTGRSKGFGDEEQLSHFYGGTIKGITNHLDYIKGLGCTALWLSPIFENSNNSYHGYAVQNYLSIDPRFGTKQDMENLVEEAHKKDMRVFLDIVLNHSADTWFYPGDNRYYYYNGIRFPFGGWRREDRPIPIELRNPELYTRMGEIRNWDAFPETIDGDFLGYKNFLNDESENGCKLLDILTKVHCYWIKELDIDGFRLDAVKHMEPLAIAKFCSQIREYTYSLNKKNFFLFGELAGGDEACNNYIGPKTTSVFEDKNIYYGLNSVLDFPLYYVLANVIKGIASPADLISRYESLHMNSFKRGEFGEFLVTFIDNHDQVGGSYKNRFGHGATELEIIAGMGFLLCTVGTPCIYYGTEQGLDGHGEGDCFIREAMFSKENPSLNILNDKSIIYKGISKIASIRNNTPALKFGRMAIRNICEIGLDFKPPHCSACLLAFSRVLFNDETLIVYNSSASTGKIIKVEIECPLRSGKKEMTYLYGGEGTVPVVKAILKQKEIYYVSISIGPKGFAILS